MFILPSNRPIEFIPESYKEKSNPPIFLLKAPSKSLVIFTQSTLASVSINTDQSAEALNKVMITFLDECVVGWKNIVDENQKPLEFNEENFSLLNDQNILMEIYLKLQEMTMVTEKNE